MRVKVVGEPGNEERSVTRQPLQLPGQSRWGCRGLLSNFSVEQLERPGRGPRHTAERSELETTPSSLSHPACSAIQSCLKKILGKMFTVIA